MDQVQTHLEPLVNLMNCGSIDQRLGPKTACSPLNRCTIPIASSVPASMHRIARLLDTLRR